MHRLLFFVAICFTAAISRGEDSLESVELKRLGQYLNELRSGQSGSAVQVEQLADMSFTGLQTVMQAYADLQAPIEPQTHRAFQALLERMSRTALLPWPMVTLYSPELGEFLTSPTSENSLSHQLFERLIESGGDRRSFDLSVRLVPQETLKYLIGGAKPHRVELLEAWNRRLGRGGEKRPIPKLNDSVAQICQTFDISMPGAEREALLKFIAFWPAQQNLYEEQLRACLESKQEELVLLGLATQQQNPKLLELNAKVISRFANNEKVLYAALYNYAFDSSQDYSGILRGFWQTLKPSQTKARYAALFAMAIHPQGNDTLALQAVLDNTYELLDVALPVLAKGDPQKVRQAIEHVLTSSERGREEVLRLATTLNLKGFEDQTIRLALDRDNEQIFRQTAMLYLRLANGKSRRQLLPMLETKSDDLRLTAIQTFGEPRGLSTDDMNLIGPELIRIALNDPSMGHRQEAIYALGNWRAKLAEAFFRKILTDNPAVTFSEGHYNDARYWQYRFRLMALLALAKLKDKSATDALVELHRDGGPIERMDALLAFMDLGNHVELAWDDLNSTEPKLVATAAALISKHGDDAARDRLRAHFGKSSLWLEFIDSGLDDHNILELAGIAEDEHAK